MKTANVSKISIFIILLCSHQIIFSQQKNPVKKNAPQSGLLSGRVIDKDKGIPLPGASVYIPDLRLGVIADSAGNYHFRNLPSGNYLLEVNFIGFKTLTQTVLITGNTEQDFVLISTAIEEAPVVVTGLSRATQITRSPIPIVA